MMQWVFSAMLVAASALPAFAEAAPEAAAAQAETGESYYVAVDGRAEGPFDRAGIEARIRARAVTAETMLWRPGAAGWSAAGAIAAIAPLLAEAAVAAGDDMPPPPPGEVPPPPPPPPPPVDIRYFVVVDGQTTGPFGTEEIRRKVEAGEVIASTLIWKKGLEGWSAAETVTEVLAMLAEAPKKPPFDCLGSLVGGWERIVGVGGQDVTIRVSYEPNGQYNGLQMAPGYGGQPMTSNFHGTWKATAIGERTCSIAASQKFPYTATITTVVEMVGAFVAADKSNGGEWRKIE